MKKSKRIALGIILGWANLGLCGVQGMEERKGVFAPYIFLKKNEDCHAYRVKRLNFPHQVTLVKPWANMPLTLSQVRLLLKKIKYVPYIKNEAFSRDASFKLLSSAPLIPFLKKARGMSIGAVPHAKGLKAWEDALDHYPDKRVKNIQTALKKYRFLEELFLLNVYDRRVSPDDSMDEDPDEDVILLVVGKLARLPKLTTLGLDVDGLQDGILKILSGLVRFKSLLNLYLKLDAEIRDPVPQGALVSLGSKLKNVTIVEGDGFSWEGTHEFVASLVKSFYPQGPYRSLKGHLSLYMEHDLPQDDLWSTLPAEISALKMNLSGVEDVDENQAALQYWGHFLHNPRNVMQLQHLRIDSYFCHWFQEIEDFERVKEGFRKAPFLQLEKLSFRGESADFLEELLKNSSLQKLTKIEIGDCAPNRENEKKERTLLEVFVSPEVTLGPKLRRLDIHSFWGGDQKSRPWDKEILAALLQKKANIENLSLRIEYFFVQDNLPVLKKISWPIKKLELSFSRGTSLEDLFHSLACSGCVKTLETLIVFLDSSEEQWRQQWSQSFPKLRELDLSFPRLRLFQVSESGSKLLFESKTWQGAFN